MLKEGTNSFSLSLNGAGRCFLNKDITILPILKGKEHQIHSLFKRHNETSHLGFCESYRITLTDLVNPEGDYTTAATHHIAITSAADLCVTTQAALGHGYLLLNSLGDSHGIDWISSLIG